VNIAAHQRLVRCHGARHHTVAVELPEPFKERRITRGYLEYRVAEPEESDGAGFRSLTLDRLLER
jgi:hypothetical protein